MELKKIFIVGLFLGASVCAPAVFAGQDTQVAEENPQASELNPQLSDVTLQVPAMKPQVPAVKPKAPEVAPQESEVKPPDASLRATEGSEAISEIASSASPSRNDKGMEQFPEVKSQVAEMQSPAPEVTPEVSLPIRQVPEPVRQVPEAKPQVSEVKPPDASLRATEGSEAISEIASSASPSRNNKGTEQLPETKPLPNLFAEHFFAPSGQKLDYKITEVRGFPVLKTHSREQNAEYSVVTDFGGGAVKSRFLSGLNDTKSIDDYIKKNLKTANFEGVEIRQLSVPAANGKATDLFWVGDKAFATAEAAAAEITSSKAMIESQGGKFAEAVRAAPFYIPEAEEPVEIKTPAQYKKEEELILKFTDQMGIGEKLYGVFQGVPPGEPIVWQSFGETSWRQTNLAAKGFDTQVGYWCNRLVFRGIRFPLHTIDPFIESTVNLQSDSADYASNLQLFAGLEWRPLARNPWLLNFQPFGGIPILEWMRNYRFYIKYGDRKNLKDDITGSADYDLIWGVQCYYEWGTELPPLDETKPEKFTDYLRQYVWGEYFGDYYVSKTNFGSEQSFNAFIANSSIIMGVKLPGIPLPHNYINDELVLMPYLRFEHVNNAQFSFYYQNQYFVAAGMRIMPFRTYRWKENEWLSKTAIFGEWIGLGRAQRVKQETLPEGVPTYDLRFGVKFSSRRF
jgi:hypothetical protein